MSNFPAKDPDELRDVLVTGNELTTEQLKYASERLLYGFRHPFVMKLMECGVLPEGCGDFTISAPVAGVMEITATYFIERESFEKAIRETYSRKNGKARAYAKDNEAYAKRRNAARVEKKVAEAKALEDAVKAAKKVAAKKKVGSRGK